MKPTDYKLYIDQALKAAKYHEDQAFHFAHPEGSNYNKAAFHLRAYYWELWSVWDYILQTANLMTLKKLPRDVRRNFLTEIRDERTDYEFLEQLHAIETDDWLKRIRALRDHAHKWQIVPHQVEYDGEQVNVISIDNPDSRDINLSRQVNVDRNDLWFINKSVHELAEAGFFRD